MNDMITQGKLKEAINKICAEDRKRDLRNRSKVAQAAKKIRLDINYTQCKQIAYIYYGLGMLNYLLAKPNETLEDYMRRTYHKYEQPYEFINV